MKIFNNIEDLFIFEKFCLVQMAKNGRSENLLNVVQYFLELNRRSKSIDEIAELWFVSSLLSACLHFNVFIFLLIFHLRQLSHISAARNVSAEGKTKKKQHDRTHFSGDV